MCFLVNGFLRDWVENERSRRDTTVILIVRTLRIFLDVTKIRVVFWWGFVRIKGGGAQAHGHGRGHGHGHAMAVAMAVAMAMAMAMAMANAIIKVYAMLSIRTGGYFYKWAFNVRVQNTVNQVKDGREY